MYCSLVGKFTVQHYFSYENFMVKWLGSSIFDIFWNIFKIELFVPMRTADEDYLSFGIDIVMN